LYYGTTATGTYPGYGVTPNTAYRITAAAGTTVYYYYTYSVPEGGQKNTSANKNNFVVGNCSSLKSAETEDLTADDYLSVYPNPVQELLNVVSLNDISRITIYDISGRNWIGNLYESGVKELTIPVGSLKQGLYLIKIEGPDKVYIKKFIKQ
jgi:hypothetical protein